MSLAKKLADRFREVTLNGKWVANTNFQLLLSDINWQEATRKTGQLNSIAALTFHVNYYIAGLNEVFAGGDLTIRDKYSFDMPNISSDDDWEALKKALFANAEEFAAAVEGFTDEQIEGPFVQPEYGSYYRNIEGIIEHCYYHLGQISLIRKLLD